MPERLRATSTYSWWMYLIKSPPPPCQPDAFINDTLENDSWQYNQYGISGVAKMIPPGFRLSQFMFHFLNLLSTE
jgi:hypothetical protein